MTSTPAILQSHLDALDEALVEVGADGRILSWGGGAARLFGIGPEEAVGIAAETLLNAPVAGRAGSFEASCTRPDGQTVELEVRVVPPTDGAEGVLFVAADVTRRNRAERGLASLKEESARRGRVFSISTQVVRDILHSRPGTDALRQVAEAARTLTRADRAAIAVADSGKGVTEFVEVGDGAAAESLEAIAPLLLDQLRGSTAPALLMGEDLALLPGGDALPGSLLFAPILRAEGLLGGLLLLREAAEPPFANADAEAAHALASHAAMAIYYQQMLATQQRLVRAIIAAQEDERRRIAYDLHDGIAQYVLASHAHLQTYRHLREAGQDGNAEKELESGIRYLKESIVESRRLINGQRSLNLEDMGLAGALEQLLNDEKGRAGWTEAFMVTNVGGKFYDKVLSTAVFRVGQEALNNIRKHAETTRIRMMLLENQDPETGAPHMTLEVRDWGRGFDMTSQPNMGDHVGLHSMRERVELLGGTFFLQSAPGEGTIVRAAFPLSQFAAGTAQEQSA
jgi:signal transduction histidine kinase